MINLDHVESFLAVVAAGGFRDAAKQLDISQSTVTQHIKQLEESLKTEVIVRSNAGCSLTAEGETFLPYAQQLVNLACKAGTLFEKKDEITIGASSNTGIYLLQPYIKKFKERTPFSVKVVIDRNEAIARTIENYDVDIAVVERWDERPGFAAKLWRREELVLIVPLGHPWASMRSVGPNQLENQVLIGGEAGSGTGRVLRRYLGTRANTLGVSLQLGSTAAVKSAVQAGLGISVVMKASVENESRLVLFSTVPFEGDPPRKEIYIVFRNGMLKHPSIAAFVDILLSRPH